MTTTTTNTNNTNTASSSPAIIPVSPARKEQPQPGRCAVFAPEENLPFCGDNGSVVVKDGTEELAGVKTGMKFSAFMENMKQDIREELAEKDGTIALLGKRLSGLEDQNEMKDATIKDLGEQMATLTATVTDTVRNDVRKELAAKDGSIKDLQERLVGLEDRIAAQDSTITMVEDTVAIQSNAIVARDSTIVSLEEKVETLQGTVATQGKTIAARDDMIVDLQGTVAVLQDSARHKQSAFIFWVYSKRTKPTISTTL